MKATYKTLTYLLFWSDFDHGIHIYSLQGMEYIAKICLKYSLPKMKKAKDYAHEIIEEHSEKGIEAAHAKAAGVVKELFKEYDEIVKMRKITKYESILAVLKELHVKWEAVCRRVNAEIPILNDKAFLNVIEEKMTMIWPNLQKIL